MRIVKWLGAIFGSMFGGVIGGVIGFIVGSAIDGFTKDEFNDFQKKTNPHNNPQIGRFEISLLILSAFVIKADGKASQKELNYVRTYFIKIYGVDKAKQLFKLFKKFVSQSNLSVRQVALEINQYLLHPTRLQLMHYLFGITNSDGIIHKSELDLLYKISFYLNISKLDFESIKATYIKSNNEAYKILEINENDSIEIIKKAYRKMAKKYHPDIVAGMGEPYISEAKKRFQKIQNAYEQIKREKSF